MVCYMSAFALQVTQGFIVIVVRDKSLFIYHYCVEVSRKRRGVFESRFILNGFQQEQLNRAVKKAAKARSLLSPVLLLPLFPSQ